MRVPALLLTLLLLLTSCAGVSTHVCASGAARCPDEGGGFGGGRSPELAAGEEAWSPPGEPSSRVEPDGEERRQAELQAANEQLWRMASASDREGTRIELELWACNGALTIESWKSSAPARTGERTSGQGSFRRALGILPEYAGRQGMRLLRLSLRRDGSDWKLDGFSGKDVAGLPPEARTLAVKQEPVPAADWETAAKLAGEWVRNLRAPGQVNAERQLAVELEDGHVLGLSTVDWRPEGKLSAEVTEGSFAWELANTLVPFIQGLGRRTVRVQLRAELLPGQARSRWRVAGAAYARSAQPVAPDEPGLTIAEYRHIHEETLRRWREDTRHHAEAAARFTAREVAIWVVGGWAMHGAGAVLKAAGSPVLRMLSRGPRAVGWLETLLLRVPGAERESILRLWAKVDTEGIEALTAGERDEFRAIVDRFEGLLSTPLGNQAKKDCRELARKRLWSSLAPELVARLLNDKAIRYEVHHLIPLEYAELFTEMDINAMENLVAVPRQVHESIGRIWTMLRMKRVTATATNIREIATIINQHYGRWYNTIYNPEISASQLAHAEAAAQAALNALYK